MKRFLPVVILLFIQINYISAQAYFPFEQIRKYTAANTPNKVDSSFKTLTNRLGPELHYLYPLYQGIGWEKKFKSTMGEKNFYGNMAQMLAFAGDYQQALKYVEKGFDSIPGKYQKEIEDSVNALKDIQYISARQAILDNADHYRVMMINESHANPIHRAFTYSLLQELYKKGYRYLAMEMLNNFANKCLDSLNVFTGYYPAEPVAGELVRYALQIGYTLVSYEDTIQTHSISQRDSLQAVNLLQVIKKDPGARILVHAGLGHISEKPIGNYTMLAGWFKKMSGIDPFTIQQVTLTEGSVYSAAKYFYDFFTKKYVISEPSVIFQRKRPFNLFDEKGYDITIIHPRTGFIHNRPSWLTLNGQRKPTLIQPTEKSLFFVQAYYDSEYDKDNLSLLIPADQTYITNNEGYYCLFLKPGKFKIVLRDVAYKILSVKDQEVN